jgi:hypothetical protein
MAGEQVTLLETPPFNRWRGDASPTSPPPFDFERVTLRFFPLAAHPLTLQRFCDGYLNLAPQIAYFRAAMPFVLLSVVDYGRMSEGDGNVGWTSQNELVFSVPVEWYERRQGRWVLREVAQVSPFIFVDNESSQVEGREVFGWPKVQGWFSPTVNPWAKHPLDPRQLLTLTTRVVDRLYDHERVSPQTLLVIDEETPPSVTVFPPEFGNPLNPFVRVPAAISAWSRLMLSMSEDLATMLLDRRLPGTAVRRIAEMGSALGHFVRTLQANTVNLKQIRDAEAPQEICYQALTNARMEITRFHQGGMLGDSALLRGDPSGGFRVQVHRYASQPIIETLGLRLSSVQPNAVPEVACLKPVFPFWQQLDLSYQVGENICWRSRDVPWQAGDSSADDRADDAHHAPPHSLRFNTTGSLGYQVATGPFALSRSTFRVLPLLADPRKLQGLCNACLNTDGRRDFRFEAYGSYVYLLITTFGDMTSQTNDFGLWTGTQVNFSVPVRWFENDELASVGYFSPFVFTDSDIGANTARELFGWAAAEAQITSPPNPWVAASPLAGDAHTVVTLKTLMFPEIDAGQESRWAPLLDIIAGGSALGAPSGQPYRSLGDDADVARRWSAAVRADLKRMRNASVRPEFRELNGLAEGLLNGRSVLNQLSLKQFRDAAHPDRACYQALVNVGTRLTKLHSRGDIWSPMQFRINRFATQPVVDSLGLMVARREGTPDGVAEYVVPVRPYYLRADIETTPAENLCWRVGSQHWQSQSKRSQRCFQKLDDAAAADAVLADDLDPHMVMQAALSHAWKKAIDDAVPVPTFGVASDIRDAEGKPLFKTRHTGPAGAGYWAPKPVKRGARKRQRQRDRSASQ